MYTGETKGQMRRNQCPAEVGTTQTVPKVQEHE